MSGKTLLVNQNNDCNKSSKQTAFFRIYLCLLSGIEKNSPSNKISPSEILCITQNIAQNLKKMGMETRKFLKTCNEEKAYQIDGFSS